MVFARYVNRVYIYSTYATFHALYELDYEKIIQRTTVDLARALGHHSLTIENHLLTKVYRLKPNLVSTHFSRITVPYMCTILVQYTDG